MNARRPSPPPTTTFLIIVETIVVITRDDFNTRAITLAYSVSGAKSALDAQDSTVRRKDTLRLSEQLELALSDDGGIPETDSRPNVSLPMSCTQRFDDLLLKGLETLEAHRGRLLDDLFERMTRDQDLGVCHVSAGPADEQSCLLLLYALRGEEPAATLIMSGPALRALLGETRGTSREDFYRSLEPMFPRLARARGIATPVHLEDALAKILIIGAMELARSLSTPSFQNDQLTN